MSDVERERSRARWRQPPDDWRQLTWDLALRGEPFVDKATQYAEIDSKNVLEVGPGYGRILQACFDRGLPFATYCGLDLSEETCSHLRKRFPFDRVSFVTGDVDNAKLEADFDVILSSLTFKHLYPTCEAGLENLSRSALPGAIFCIDFAESQKPEALWHLGTFIRRYTRDELLEILERTGLEHVAFDEVRHARNPQWWRLLMVARKPN